MKRKRSRQDSSGSKFTRKGSKLAPDVPDGTRKSSWFSTSSGRSSSTLISLNFISRLLRLRQKNQPSSTSDPRPLQSEDPGQVLTPESSDLNLGASDTKNTGPVLQLSGNKRLDSNEKASLGLHNFQFTSSTNAHLHDELLKLRNRGLKLQQRLQVQRDVLRESLNLIEQSLMQLDGLYRSASNASGKVGTNDKIRVALDLNRTCLQRVLTSLVQVRDLEQQIQDLDIELLQRKSKNGVECCAFCSIVQISNEPNELDDLGGPTGEPSLALGAEHDTPSLLEQYFLRRGDLLMYRDELTDLEEQYEDSMGRQQIQQDRGEAPDEWHENYLRNFDSSRNAVLENIRQAGQDMDELRQACIKQGLRAEDLQPRSEASGSASPTRTSHSPRLPNVQRPLRTPESNHEASTFGLLATKTFNTLPQSSQRSSKISLQDTARTESWIDALSLDASSLPLPHDLSFPIDAAASSTNDADNM